MLNPWLAKNEYIHLPKLFEFMGAELMESNDSFVRYSFEGKPVVVVYTGQGYRYYHIARPELKLQASDLISSFVAKVEGDTSQNIWSKIDRYFQKVLNTEKLLIHDNTRQPLKVVQMDFNHFNGFVKTPFKSSNDFYSDRISSEKFVGRISCSRSKEILFPLFNLQNELCGYFKDSDQGIRPLSESSLDNSLWYSNIPDSIDWLIVFKDPKEAVAFDKKFNLANAVYLALGTINYETTRILFQIHRLTKVKKIVLSFTGSKKIEGYLRDLHFISLMNDSNFKLRLSDAYLTVRFKTDDEKAFARFYKHCRSYNEGLTKSFLDYNKVLDQHLINKYSLSLSQEEDVIKVRVPLEVDAIKYFVWSYYKNYLNKTLDVFKPKYANWYSEWEASQGIPLKGKEVHLEDYRIAL